MSKVQEIRKEYINSIISKFTYVGQIIKTDVPLANWQLGRGPAIVEVRMFSIPEDERKYCINDVFTEVKFIWEDEDGYDISATEDIDEVYHYLDELDTDTLEDLYYEIEHLTEK